MNTLITDLEYLNDTLALILCVGMVVLYEIYLFIRVKRNPRYSVQAVNRYARAEWVKSMMSRPDRNILGIQTLRNSTMAATFMASTAVLLIMGTLNLSGEAPSLTKSWHVLNAFGSSMPSLWIVKLLCLISTFFVTFFSFSMAVRLYTHVGFQLCVPKSQHTRQLTPETVAVHLNRAGTYYSIGMRSYYYAVPLVFWLFGPIFMLASTMVLVAVMYQMDRSPQDMDEGDDAAPEEEPSSSPQ